MTDHRAIARNDRVTVAHALHCHFMQHRHVDLDTFTMLKRLVRRYGMHNIGQMPSALPLGIWRAVDSVFPGDMAKSEMAAVRRLAALFAAERAAKAVEEMMNSFPTPLDIREIATI